MPLFAGGVLAGGKSLSLLRDDVHEARTVKLSNRRKRVDERVDVVSVDGSEIAKAKFLEQHARGEEGLHAFLPLPHERADRPRIVGDLAQLRAHAIVERIALDGREILVHRAHVGSDGHLVVIQHNDEIAAGVARIVQPLVRQPAREGTVAENSDDLEVLLAIDVACGRHAKSG